MQTVTPEFAEAIRSSHTVLQRAELYRGNELLIDNLPLLGGTITDDSQAVIRRRVSMSLASTTEVLNALAESVPLDGGLWPVGNEIKLYSGLRLPSGDEYLGVGVYRISKPVVNQTPEGITITLDGYDRARAVNRAKFTEPYVIAAGTNYANAIKDLILSRLPTLNEDNEFQFMETTYETPQLVFTTDDDPMEVAIKMASSMGAELFFNGGGVCILRPEPNPLYDEPEIYYSETEAMLTNVHRDLDDEQAFNGVIVVSENSDLPAPLRAEAWDTNENSPTYYDPDFPEASLYGAVPSFVNTQYITTQDQCQDAADAELARVLGVIEDISFGTVANPAHESGDIISVEAADSNVEGVNILSSLTLNFGSSGPTMQGVTRKRRQV